MRQNFFASPPCETRKVANIVARVRKQRRAPRGSLGGKAKGEEKNSYPLDLLSRARTGIGKGRQRVNASCDSGQALEKAQNGNGRLFSKVGMDLGLAPRRLGVGATSAWGSRRVGLGFARALSD